MAIFLFFLILMLLLKYLLRDNHDLVYLMPPATSGPMVFIFFSLCPFV